MASHRINTLPIKYLVPRFLLCSLAVTLCLRGYGQQDSIPCNTRTPWVPPTFSVSETHSATGLLTFWSNTGNVVDANTGNFATATIALGGTVTMRVSETGHVYSGGDFVGFHIASSLFNLGILSGVTIRTFLNGTPRESYVTGNLIGLSTAFLSGPFDVGFVTDSSFNQIEIDLTAGLLGSYDVYYAVVEGFCQGPDLECNVQTPMNKPTFPTIIDYANTGSDGLTIGNVDNPDNAVSSDTSDYASLISIGGAIGNTYIAVSEEVTDYPAGTFVGFDIENNALLDLDVLGNLTITSFLNGVQQESISGSNLLVNAPLLQSSGRQTVGFVTTTAVDEVKLIINQTLVADLGTTRVYSAIFQTFCEGPDLPCNMLTEVSTPEYPVYINSANSGLSGAVCAGCTIIGPGNLIDGDTSNYAEVVITAGVATTGSISVKDALTDYPAGTFAGFHLQNIDLVDLGVLDGITITTYLDGTQQEQVSGTDLLVTLGTDLLVSNGEIFAGFVTTESFDEVQLSLTNVGAVDIGTTDVYGALFGAFCAAEVVCDTTYFLNQPDFPVYVDFQRTGLTGAVCGLCAVNNPENVITEDTADYANIKIAAGVLNTGSIAVRDALYTYPPGTLAGFVIDDLNGTLQADLFGTITISTYLDGVLQESKTGSDLIDAELLVLFINPDVGVHNVGFETTLPFDEIRITVGALASVLNDINVYGAFVDTRNSNGGDLNCPNAPVAVNDTTATNEDNPVVIDVLENDSDSDSPLGIPDIIDGPSNGSASVNGDSTVTYTPDENFVGVDSFTYAICDDGMPSLCDTATVVVTVNPVIDTVYYSIPEDSTVTTCADSLTTFTDPATDISTCNDPSDGALAVNGTCVTYTPAPDFNGMDTFCVVVCDPNDPLLCDTTIVIVTVNPVNDPPDAADDSDATSEDTPVNVDVLGNDSDPDSPLGIPDVIDGPSNGSASVNGDSTVTYTPDENFVGVDSFTYAICDDGTPALCDTATVVVTVNPVIDTVYYSIPEDSTVTTCADSLTTFTDPATDISTCNDPSDGALAVNGTCVTYTPAPDFNGMDTFCVVVCDPNDPLLCDTTIVIVTVNPVNDPPDAADDSGATSEDTPVNVDVLGNDSDPDSPLGIPDIIDGPSNGSASVNGDSTVTYTPDENFVGVDSFTYAICDDGTPALCDTATVVVTVNPVIDTVYYSIPEDSTVTTCADSLTTFTDPATDISTCNDPSDGALAVNGTCVTYTPAQDFNGMDTFCVVVCDPNDPLLCDTTIVIVTVNPVNDPPVAEDDSAATSEDTPVNVDVLGNDSDPDSPLGIPDIIDGPSNGSASVNGDSTVTYTPDENFVGVDSFTYAICDDGMPSLCDTATVVVTVNPVIDTVYYSIPEDSTVTTCADSLTTFTDPATSIAVCDDPSNGNTNISGTCITYMPDPDWSGIDTFCVIGCDPNGICDTTIVIVTVECPSVSVHVLLEGPYDTGSGLMSTTLNAYHVLPGQDPTQSLNPGAQLLGVAAPHGQPYNASPWNWAGTEGDHYGDDVGDTPYPSDITDWVLVSVRQGDSLATSEVWKCAGLLHSDGTVEFPPDCACAHSIENGNHYYVIVEHRNHLPVMSPVMTMSNNVLSFDFTQHQSWIYSIGGIPVGSGQRSLGGKYAMYAGNSEQISARVDINSSDDSQWLNDNGAIFTYQRGDHNLDGDTNATDEFIWLLNNSIFTLMPF